MTIIGGVTLRLPTLPDRDALRSAAAAAFAVPINVVSVGEYYGDENPFPDGYCVCLNPLESDGEGDLPVAFDQKIDEQLVSHLDTTVQRLAERLSMIVVTDDSEAAFPIIHLPDGTSQQRRLTSLPDGGLLLPPDIKAAISRQSARAA